MKHSVFFFLLLLIASCEPQVHSEKSISVTEYYSSDFFKEVQLQEIFPDSKTFVDCKPRQSLHEILKKYKNEKEREGFSLREFIFEHFEQPITSNTTLANDGYEDMSTFLQNSWSFLTQKTDVNSSPSLISLPRPYIMSGGRQRELHYWDSYFIIEGLLVSGQEVMAQNMVSNLSFLIDSIGFVPSGNRNYYLTRSQPPFFALMVNRITNGDSLQIATFLPQLEKEYAFWTTDDRTVEMPDGSLLNRFWDSTETPRPEFFKEDYELIKSIPDTERPKKYQDIRASAESVWDLSSRWLADGKTISTIQTTDIIPVDLNSLIYFLETQISLAAAAIGNESKAKEFSKKSVARKAAINKYLWSQEDGFFIDYNFVKEEPTGILSLASSYPLFCKIADQDQADIVIEILFRDFLSPGGLTNSLNNTELAWDKPFGFASLQWISVQAMVNYGYPQEAAEVANRWMYLNRKVYNATGKMMERYNVVDTSEMDVKFQLSTNRNAMTIGVALALETLVEELDI